MGHLRRRNYFQWGNDTTAVASGQLVSILGKFCPSYNPKILQVSSKLKLDVLHYLLCVEKLTSDSTLFTSRFCKSTCWALISCSGRREQLTFRKASFSAWLPNWTYWSKSDPSHRTRLRSPGLGTSIIWKTNTKICRSWQTTSLFFHLTPSHTWHVRFKYVNATHRFMQSNNLHCVRRRTVTLH